MRTHKGFFRFVYCNCARHACVSEMWKMFGLLTFLGIPESDTVMSIWIKFAATWRDGSVYIESFRF